MRTPLEGALSPTNKSGRKVGHTTASCSCCLAKSRPAMSSQDTPVAGDRTSSRISCSSADRVPLALAPAPPPLPPLPAAPLWAGRPRAGPAVMPLPAALPTALGVLEATVLPLPLPPGPRPPLAPPPKGARDGVAEEEEEEAAPLGTRASDRTAPTDLPRLGVEGAALGAGPPVTRLEGATEVGRAGLGPDTARLPEAPRTAAPVPAATVGLCKVQRRPGPGGCSCERHAGGLPAVCHLLHRHVPHPCRGLEALGAVMRSTDSSS